MTATRIGKGATVAVGAALWIVAAIWLWRTSVPSSLRLPHVDGSTLASAREISRAERFDDVSTWITVSGALVQLAVLAAVAWFGPRLSRSFAVGRVGRGVLVGLAAATFVWAAGLPFDAASAWWQRRYGLSTQSWVGWAGAAWGSLAGIAVDATIVVAVLMALAAALPRAWWVAASAVAVAGSVVVLLVLPYLLSIGTHRVDDPQLAADIRAVAQREGVAGTPVRVDDVTDTTTAVNAYTIGIGPSERVVLWNTLLFRLDPREVLFVTAHEFGHVKARHLLKGLGWTGLVALPELLLVALITRRRGGLAQPAAVPVALLVTVAFGLVTAPAQNAISRRYEAEADWYALQTTQDPASGEKAFRSFVGEDLEPPTASTLEYLWFDNHPTVVQRVAMVRAWKARYGATARPFPASP